MPDDATTMTSNYELWIYETTTKQRHIPGLILNLREHGCLLIMNLMGWSVDCLCRSVAEISCNSRSKKNGEKHEKSVSDGINTNCMVAA